MGAQLGLCFQRTHLGCEISGAALQRRHTCDAGVGGGLATPTQTPTQRCDTARAPCALSARLPLLYHSPCGKELDPERLARGAANGAQRAGGLGRAHAVAMCAPVLRRRSDPAVLEGA